MTRALAALLSLAVAQTASADGLYFSQQVGIGASDEPGIGRAMRTRAGLGARLRFLALEGWIMSDTQLDRDGAFRGLIGGDPAEGRSDLAHFGGDLKALAPLHRTQDTFVEGYVRVRGSYVTAHGALDGYRGYGVGAGYGFQIRGRVRALGFLWGPLFFVNKGPKVTAALFVDHGTELVRLRMAGDRLETRVDQLTMGFAVGQSF